jgi:hypothetical protein
VQFFEILFFAKVKTSCIAFAAQEVLYTTRIKCAT